MTMKLLSHHHRVLFTATLKTFRHMLQYSNVNTYNAMIQSSEKKVAQPFGPTEKPNSVSSNQVIQDLCRKSRIPEAMVMLEKMNRKGLAPDKKTYKAMFHLFFCQSLYEQAYKVLTEMVVRETLEEAVRILMDMAEMGLSPNVVSYNEVMSGFCLIQNLEKAFEIKKEMVKKGFLLDAATYWGLIRDLCLHRRLSEAFDLFREMLCGGVYTFVSQSYFSLRNTYCAEGEFSKAFHLQDEMIHNGILCDFVTGFSPSLVTYHTLIV
ncbi:pentatricopeptide repeat-containing protein At5g39710-like [Lotus japonicus]|uniref:pentatricopeptide repeat-containing protein At5g39710-like n=1 Tax=Lotus japonicus TaxID=34305 RepID=UPI00258DEF25|nr:pentatricopeptide repeat-containing protein At5g39710-like [Lotus japonicus]